MEKITRMVDDLVRPEDQNTLENVLAYALLEIPYSNIELNENNHRLVSDKAFKSVFAEALDVSLKKTVADLEKKLKQVFIFKEAFAFKITAERLVLSPTDEWALTSKLDGKITELTTLLGTYSRLERSIFDQYARYMEEPSDTGN